MDAGTDPGDYPENDEHHGEDETRSVQKIRHHASSLRKGRIAIHSTVEQIGIVLKVADHGYRDGTSSNVDRKADLEVLAEVTVETVAGVSIAAAIHPLLSID